MCGAALKVHLRPEIRVNTHEETKAERRKESGQREVEC